MKHERLIHIWISIDEVYLGMVRVLSRGQKVDILKFLEVGLWQTSM